MPLPDSQVKFIENNAQGKSEKEIRDMVGMFYKQRIRKFIKGKKEPKPIKSILGIK